MRNAMLTVKRGEDASLNIDRHNSDVVTCVLVNKTKESIMRRLKHMFPYSVITCDQDGVHVLTNINEESLMLLLAINALDPTTYLVNHTEQWEQASIIYAGPKHDELRNWQLLQKLVADFSFIRDNYSIIGSNLIQSNGDRYLDKLLKH